MEKLKVIITGATGMVGEGVLLECLNSSLVESVLIINRKSLGLTHTKLKEIIHADFYDLSSIEKDLTDYNTCLFCLGVSSVGMDKDTYYKVTYQLTMQFAKILRKLNEGMTFCYVSGAGTDRTEKSSSSWARVKGKTENDLLKLGFKNMFGFRPGFIKPTAGQTIINPVYKYINWTFPIGRAIYPNGFCTMKELGQAMIHVSMQGYPKDVITGKDIIKLGKE